MKEQKLQVFILGYEIPEKNYRCVAVRAKYEPRGIYKRDGSLSFDRADMYEIEDYIEITCNCGTVFLYSDAECKLAIKG